MTTISVQAFSLNLALHKLSLASEKSVAVPSFESETGKTPQSLRELAEQAHVLDSLLDELVEKTEELLTNAAEDYVQQDSSIAINLS